MDDIEKHISFWAWVGQFPELPMRFHDARRIKAIIKEAREAYRLEIAAPTRAGGKTLVQEQLEDYVKELCRVCGHEFPHNKLYGCLEGGLDGDGPCYCQEGCGDYEYTPPKYLLD